MTDRTNLSRRHFLQSAGSLTGAAYLKLLGPAALAVAQSACSAKQQGATFKTLSAVEADSLAAIAARIIPTTDTPGATEAGVIHFIDNALADLMSDIREPVREGLTAFNVALGDAHAGTTSLAELGDAEQDAFLRTQESSEFFQLMWMMTIFGFFAMEKYGGNRDHLSWDLIGFEGNHGGWQYPFGYYDAEVHQEAGDGE